MRTGYLIGITLTVTLLLGGCYNRFEEYQPYSAFDERMAAEDDSPAMTPDDQYPPMMRDDTGFSASIPKKQRPATPTGNTVGTSLDNSDEVPFNSSRNTKQAYNVGASQ